VVVVLLLVVVFAAVLTPPAVRANQARRHAFMSSFGQPDGSEAGPLLPRRSPHVERRRQIIGGLLVAMIGTGLIGLLPTFRTLLIVHLFLVDAFLAYVALLAHLGDVRARRGAGAAVAPEPVAAEDVGRVARLEPASRPHPARRRAPRIPVELPPVAAAG
jgi:hypothetical protein